MAAVTEFRPLARSLLFEAQTADFTEAVKEHCTGQGVARLTLVEARIHTTAQHNAL